MYYKSIVEDCTLEHEQTINNCIDDLVMNGEIQRDLAWLLKAAHSMTEMLPYAWEHHGKTYAHALASALPVCTWGSVARIYLVVPLAVFQVLWIKCCSKCCESAAADERKEDYNYKKRYVACCNTSPGNVCWTFYEMFRSGRKYWLQ